MLPLTLILMLFHLPISPEKIEQICQRSSFVQLIFVHGDSTRNHLVAGDKYEYLRHATLSRMEGLVPLPYTFVSENALFTIVVVPNPEYVAEWAKHKGIGVCGFYGFIVSL